MAQKMVRRAIFARMISLDLGFLLSSNRNSFLQNRKPECFAKNWRCVASEIYDARSLLGNTHPTYSLLLSFFRVVFDTNSAEQTFILRPEGTNGDSDIVFKASGIQSGELGETEYRKVRPRNYE